MVTLKDIAAEAGVSITTVSNVVHNRKSRVSEKKVAKIWEIIEREHYVPSMSARSLANDQSAIIAMVTYITPLHHRQHRQRPLHEQRRRQRRAAHP